MLVENQKYLINILNSNTGFIAMACWHFCIAWLLHGLLDCSLACFMASAFCWSFTGFNRNTQKSWHSDQFYINVVQIHKCTIRQTYCLIVKGVLILLLILVFFNTKFRKTLRVMGGEIINITFFLLQQILAAFTYS